MEVERRQLADDEDGREVSKHEESVAFVDDAQHLNVLGSHCHSNVENGERQRKHEHLEVQWVLDNKLYSLDRQVDLWLAHQVYDDEEDQSTHGVAIVRHHHLRIHKEVITRDGRNDDKREQLQHHCSEEDVHSVLAAHVLFDFVNVLLNRRN